MQYFFFQNILRCLHLKVVLDKGSIVQHRTLKLKSNKLLKAQWQQFSKTLADCTHGLTMDGQSKESL